MAQGSSNVRFCSTPCFAVLNATTASISWEKSAYNLRLGHAYKACKSQEPTVWIQRCPSCHHRQVIKSVLHCAGRPVKYRREPLVHWTHTYPRHTQQENIMMETPYAPPIQASCNQSSSQNNKVCPVQSVHFKACKRNCSNRSLRSPPASLWMAASPATNPALGCCCMREANQLLTHRGGGK